MKHFSTSLIRVLRPTLLAILGLLLVAGLLAFRLRSLLPGLSTAEITARAGSSSARYIFYHPLNAPYTLLVYALLRLHVSAVWALRAASGFYGIVTATLFFYILKHWQRVRVAIFGTALFVTSSWFLSVARGGTPEVLQFGLLALVAAGLWLRHGRQRLLVFVVCLALGVATLYIPGLIWFVLLGLIWRRRLVWAELSKLRWWTIAGGAVLAAALAAPLGLAIWRDHTLALTALGLPTHLPKLGQVGNNLQSIPRLLFLHGPAQPAKWLSGTAILDVFATAMFALGIYAQFRFRELDRARLLIAVLLGSTILIALGGPVTISLLVPFVYTIVAAGVTYLLYEWLRVFPFNPIARGLGIGILSLAIAASASYQLDRYFIAWPNAPATRAAYAANP